VSRPALFLDRDGTLIVDPGYLRDPSTVRLIPGVGLAIQRFVAAGYLPLVVTNQSGLARGLLTWDEYHAVAARMAELLAAEGVSLAGTWLCPHAPEVSGPCECRKPGLLNYHDAIAALDLTPAESIWIGDRVTDLEPARALGGRGVLVLTGERPEEAERARTEGFPVVADLPAAAARLLGPER
jgi:D-glycero-D-manno-heptose 1,7-bisphosphate phosphatase